MKDYEKTGLLKTDDLKLPTEEQLKRGVAIIECIQKIPCNPCVTSCPVDGISMEDINALPLIEYNKCIGCAKCVGICPGLAIFVIKYVDDNKALLTLPYEMLSILEKGDIVEGLNRKGEKIDDVKVKKIIKKAKTYLVTVETDKKNALEIRNIRAKK